MWRQILFRVILFVGCGGLLTLFSSLYSRPGNAMYLDVVPTEEGDVMFGFPFPICNSYAAWWGNFDSFEFHATFIWEGALLDVIVYAFVLWVGFRVAKAVKAQVAK